MDTDLDIVFECQGVSHWFGRKKVLHDVNLQVVRGEIVGVVGPSGCGKSTLLRAILGTHPPRAGAIRMNGVAVTKPGRDRGIVYQRYSLFPHLKALENVAFGLMLDEADLRFRLLQCCRWRKLRRQHREQAETLLEKVGLGSALSLYPAEMSGGMRQRVAIAQALIMKPQLLLLDEPFGALDEATREELQDMLLELYQENLKARKEGRDPPYTILIVTHELNEALYVADRVVGLSQHWDWRGAGWEACPGATIVYDSVAPVFGPREVRRFEVFLEQREELRRVAFSPDFEVKPASYLRFWEEYRQGKGGGILAREGDG